MHFVHADSIWSMHPNLRALTLVLDRVRDMKSDRNRMQNLTARIEERLASRAESEMPEISAWREAFSKMGLKPTQYRCASEALLRRYRKERSMPSFHPLVDYLNFVSMSFALPIAAFDCDKIADGITVRPADGSEIYETFNGEVEHPAPNETIFADQDGAAHSRRWTHRQSAKSVVRSETNRALVVVEALHSTADHDIGALDDELRSGFSETAVQVTQFKRLGPSARRFEFQS